MKKIVTTSGSLRFLGRIQETAERLEIENGWVVFAPLPHVIDRPLTDHEG